MTSSGLHEPLVTSHAGINCITVRTTETELELAHLDGSPLLLSGVSWDWRKKAALAGMLVLSQLGGG